MNRLHIPTAEIHGDSAKATGEALSYLRDVLRLGPGAPVEIFDGEGGIYAAKLRRYEDGGAVFSLGAREDKPFGGVRIVLLQGLPKGDKFELIVQKAVELGVASIVPVACERSIVRLDDRKAAERVVRWQRIANEAARQSGRADVPAIAAVTDLHTVVRGFPDCRRVVLDEEERTRRLRDSLGKPDQSHVALIGPEGGLTRHEVNAAAEAGFVPVTLGPRILRTETAGLAVAAIIQHVLGDLG